VITMNCDTCIKHDQCLAYYGDLPGSCEYYMDESIQDMVNALCKIVDERESSVQSR